MKKESKNSIAKCNGSVHHVAWGREGTLDSLLLPSPSPGGSSWGARKGRVCKMSHGRVRKGQSDHLESTYYVSGTSRLSLL